MKKKFLLAVLAMVVAIGMSFATEKSTADPNWDYVDMGTHAERVLEVDCGEGNIECSVQFESDGPEYPIYDDPGLQLRKEGSGTVIEL